MKRTEREPLYYSASEAARVLGVKNVDTIHRWAASGKLLSVRIGKRLFLPRCQDIFHPERLIERTLTERSRSERRYSLMIERHNELRVNRPRRKHLVDKIA